MKLTDLERLSLFHQCLILSKIDSEESHSWGIKAEILEKGYELEFSGVFDALSPIVPAATSTFVLHVFDMFRAIQDALRNGVAMDPAEESVFQFRGFDGNEEGPYYRYARFVIEKKGWFEEFRDGPLNSHYPTLDKYSGMLAAWNSSANRSGLTAEDLKRVADAALGRE
jgi:uncharacterized protein YfbU (UPF0304 family)